MVALADIPLSSVAVAVIVAVPALTAVTLPVESIVATSVFVELHVISYYLHRQELL